MYQLAITSLVVLLGLSVNCNQYEGKLTKLWSLSSVRSGSPRTAVVNVTGGSISVDPTSYTNDGVRSSRQAKMPMYAFKPRGIPVNKNEDQVSQVERSIHYVDDKKQKTEILFPGNYFKISEVKREVNSTEGTTFNPLQGGPFHPKIIPLIRNQFKRRSMGEDQTTLEKPNGYTEPSAMRRSISYLFGEDGEEEDDDEDEDIEIDVKDDASDKDNELRHKIKKKKFKIKKKYAKYMLPLLLAYKLKFFALIPVLMGGLVLLVGATGLAGFFFALFAAVMGLQKGSY